jgi:hypothetical protein
MMLTHRQVMARIATALRTARLRTPRYTDLVNTKKVNIASKPNRKKPNSVEDSSAGLVAFHSVLCALDKPIQEERAVATAA